MHKILTVVEYNNIKQKLADLKEENQNLNEALKEIKDMLEKIPSITPKTAVVWDPQARKTKEYTKDEVV